MMQGLFFTVIDFFTVITFWCKGCCAMDSRAAVNTLFMNSVDCLSCFYLGYEIIV